MRIATTSYRDGTGVPVVLLHAFPIDHRVWDNCARSLIEQADGQGFEPFPVYAPDMPGAGESPVPSPEDTGAVDADGAYGEAMDRMAEAIVDQVLRANGHERAMFVGISMGAYLALAIHRLHPDAVAGLVIVDSKAANDGPAARADRIRIARECIEGHTVGPVMHFAQPHDGDSDFKKSDLFISTFTRWINEQTPAGVAWRELMAAGRRDESDQLPALRVPAGLISGDRDPSSNPDAMRTLVAPMENTHVDFTVIEDSGHFSSFEKPREVAAALLTTYRRVCDEQLRLHPQGADVREAAAPFANGAAKAADPDDGTSDDGANDSAAAKAAASSPALGLTEGLRIISPIAMMQPLRYLPLAQDVLDDRTYDRGKPGFMDDIMHDPDTSVFLVSHGLVAVPRGARLHPRLALLPAEYVRDAVADASGALAMFMGTHTVAGRMKNYVAVDVSRVMDTVPDAAQVSADNDFGETADTGSSAADLLFAERASSRFDWCDLRDFAPNTTALDAGLATRAISLASWHASQRFCPCCASPVETVDAGWAQRCTNEADRNRMLFPRIEPAVITMIVDAHDRILLQHNATFPGTLYSVCAGFVEAGESLEHAVRRECLEETGVEVGELRYLGSQVWPFPASLMAGFVAQATTDDVHIDDIEVSDARWMSRDDLTRALANDEVTLPGKAAIARYMISQWYGKEL